MVDSVYPLGLYFLGYFFPLPLFSYYTDALSGICHKMSERREVVTREHPFLFELYPDEVNRLWQAGPAIGGGLPDDMIQDLESVATICQELQSDVNSACWRKLRTEYVGSELGEWLHSQVGRGDMTVEAITDMCRKLMKREKDAFKSTMGSPVRQTHRKTLVTF